MSWRLRNGANKIDKGAIEFRVWAPKAKNVSLVLLEKGNESMYPMTREENDYFQIRLSNLGTDVSYLFNIDHEKRRPDPVSKWQPQGVHGPSKVYFDDFIWQDQNWYGLPLKDYIIYELHVGTFTPEGTFEAIIQKLDYLKDLGVTAIEMMPPIEFPGTRNWGYDGVYPYAPHHLYGGPSELKKLINACHMAGLAVIVDVVYNHLGPEGNYLNDFGHYFTDHYKTPWGQAINFDGPNSDPVRQYFIDNALYWLTEFHIDALRLDAVHAIFDFSARHVLEEIHTAFYDEARKRGKQAYLIAESDLNDVRIVNPIEKGGYHIDAQWSDDFHHSVHALLTKSSWGYFMDFGQISQLAKAFQEGFVYDGIYSKYRKKTFGNSSKNLSGEHFVVCIQNHDQIGNAGQGKRLSTFITKDQYKLASTLLFFAPNIPLIFMGQEWKSSSPFLFFTSYEDQELAKAVREGYIKEFQLNGEDRESLDPQNPHRFHESKLIWSELHANDHEEIFQFYKHLIQLRKLPCLSNMRKDLIKTNFNEKEKWMTILRTDPTGSKALLVSNFSGEEGKIAVLFPQGQWTLACTSSDYPSEHSLNLEKETSLSLSLQKMSCAVFVS